MFNLTIQKLGDVTVFRCAGRLTAGDGDNLRRSVISQPPIRMAVLDFAGIEAVDAAGLGTLVYLRQWAQATGRKLKLMNVVPRVEQALRLTHLKPVFDICTVPELFELLCRATKESEFVVAAA
jgi:anti-anti-sigma factor